MEFVTFLGKLSNQDKNYPNCRLGRIIIQNKEPILQVYGIDNKFLNVKNFKIELKYPFNKEYKYGLISYHAGHGRICITLYSDIKNKNMFLSRYIYLINNNGEIEEEYHVDHKDGNKLNDKLENLNAIPLILNTRKSKYSNYWLTSFNIQNDTTYLEQDLLDKHIFDKVVEFAKPQQLEIKRKARRESYHKNPEEYKQRNNNYKAQNYEKVRQMYRNHYEKNKDKIKEYNKEYREQNKEIISKQRKETYENNKDIIKANSNEYYHSNKETINEKRKLYRQQNHQFIQARKTLFQRLSILDKKQWTKEIGDKYIDTLNKIFKLYNVTLEDITQGLDITKFSMATINSLNRLKLLYSEQLGKLDD